MTVTVAELLVVVRQLLVSDTSGTTSAESAQAWTLYVPTGVSRKIVTIFWIEVEEPLLRIG